MIDPETLEAIRTAATCVQCGKVSNGRLLVARKPVCSTRCMAREALGMEPKP